MSKDISKKVINVTGVELTPANPKECLGNGEQGYECCCDECDYFFLCFPKYAEELEEVANTTEISFSHRHKIRMNRIFRDVAGSKTLPFPEVDNAYERLRSKIVVTFAKKKKKK